MNKNFINGLVIGLLSMSLIGSVSYIVFDKLDKDSKVDIQKKDKVELNESKEEINVNNENNKIDEKIDEEVELNINDYEKYIKLFDSFIPDYVEKKFLLTGETVYAKNLTSDQKMYLTETYTLQNTNLKVDYYGKPEKIKEEVFKDNFTNLFGDLNGYNINYFDENYSEGLIQLYYNDSPSRNTLYTEVIKITKTSNELYIYEKYAIIDYCYNEDDNVDLYGDTDKKILIEKNAKIKNGNIISKNSLPKVKYVFKIKDNNYIFDKVEVIK